MTTGASVEARQKILEPLERTQLAVHREGMTQRISDAGVNRGRSHLHEASGGEIDHRFFVRIHLFHASLTSGHSPELQMLRSANGNGMRPWHE